MRGDSGPVALESLFGWVLSGPVNVETRKVSNTNMLTHSLRIDLEKTLSETAIDRLWDLETLGIKPVEKSRGEKILENIKRASDNRYIVNLPKREEHLFIADNYELCKKRLMSKFKQLKRNPELLRQYDDIFKEQMRQVIVEHAPEHGEAGLIHYLPHHEVVRSEKQTTKVRIVFYASSNSNGPSLNDCLLKGPQLTPLLFYILIRFRYFTVALTADIEKALLQIGIAEENRDLLRFLRFDDILKDEPVIVRHRFARVVFGVNSSLLVKLNN